MQKRGMEIEKSKPIFFFFYYLLLFWMNFKKAVLFNAKIQVKCPKHFTFPRFGSVGIYYNLREKQI